MAQFDQEAYSFIIRIWKENSEELSQTAVWRGWIRHVQSDKQHYFTDVAEIGTIVAGYLDPNAERDILFEPIQGKKS
jgi:hypothetical protein